MRRCRHVLTLNISVLYIASAASVTPLRRLKLPPSKTVVRSMLSTGDSPACSIPKRYSECPPSRQPLVNCSSRPCRPKGPAR